MKRTSKNMAPISLRISVYLNPRGGSAVADTIRKVVYATHQAFNGNVTATANALGYSTKTVRKILGGINGEWTDEGAQLREADSQSTKGDLP